MHYVVAVTGGREYDDLQVVNSTLTSLHTGGHLLRPLARISLIVQGGCTGADELARGWAIMNVVQFCTFQVTETQWLKVGRRAGPARNRLMLEVTRPNLLVAFPGGGGTANCVKTARELGIEVLEVGRG